MTIRERVNTVPKVGAKGFLMRVTPDGEHLQQAIADNGRCEPKRCWHRVAILAVLLAWDPKLNPTHAVKVDAGHIKVQYKGWRYIADSPQHVKRSLMLFDKGLYDQLYIREYSLRFRRTTKIVPLTPKKKAQNAAAQEKRRAEGRYTSPPPAGLRKRVEGFSGIV